jgi:hypothetical protein
MMLKFLLLVDDLVNHISTKIHDHWSFIFGYGLFFEVYKICQKSDNFWIDQKSP